MDDSDLGLGLADPLLNAARWAVRSYRLSFDGDDDAVVRLPEAAAVELIRKLATAVSVGSTVRQIIPLAFPVNSGFRSTPGALMRADRFAPALRNTDEFTQVVARILAANHRTVERLYLVPPGGVPADTVDDRLARDQAMQMEAKCFQVVDEIDSPQGDRDLAKVVSQTPMSNMWIVDDQVVLMQEATAAGPPVWRVSARPNEVNEASGLWRRLWNCAKERVSELSLDFDLTDTLVVSAEQMAAAAPMSCAHQNGSLQHCDWYHGVWQYLRLFDLVSSPRWHHNFYLDELTAALGDGGRHRVLISGASDYSMLAYVLHATRGTVPGPGSQSRVEVLDRCATPLLACRWYAQQSGADVRVHEMDIRKPNLNILRRGSYDLITTDAFLTRFTPDAGDGVLDTWNTLLADKGKVVTTVRLHPHDHPYAGVSDEISDFVARARQAAQRWRPYLRTGIDQIAADARQYAERITSSNLGDEKSVVELFERHKFAIDYTESTDRPGETCNTRYLRIVATKMGAGRA